MASHALADRRGPMIVYVRILEACNAGCSMCPFQHSVDSFRLSLPRLRSLVGELQALGTEELRFTGGEPTLHPDILEAIATVRAHGLRASLITNGSRLLALADALCGAGLTGVVCSIDSPRADVHDRVRATPGLFAQACEGLTAIAEQRDARGHRLRITVNSVVSSETYRHLDEFIPLLDSLGVEWWNLIPIKDKKSLFLSARQLDEFTTDVMPRLAARLTHARVRLNAVNPMIFGADDAGRQSSLRGHLPTHTRCFVPFMMAYIDAKRGTLTACNCLVHRRGKPLSSEGVWTRPFAEIWNDAAFAVARREFAGIASSVCTGCEPANIRFNREADLSLAEADIEPPAWI
jgi:cytosylglucuronate decarboxylase